MKSYQPVILLIFLAAVCCQNPLSAVGGQTHPPSVPQVEIGWTQSWLGWSWTTDGHWYQHIEHGWLYITGEITPVVWAFDAALGRWFYFAQNMYPNIYIEGTGRGWFLYFSPGNVGSRYFYSYNRSGWFIETALFDLTELVFVQTNPIPAEPDSTFSMQDYWSDGGPRGDPRPTSLSNYRIGRKEVTLKQWKEVRAWAVENGYETLGSIVGIGCDEEHPVVNVNWYDAVKWCNARSEKEGLEPVYYLDALHTEVYRSNQTDLTNENAKWDATGYRLPTEAEWEFAARGGRHREATLYSGSDDLDAVAWHGFSTGGDWCDLGFSNGTRTVGTKLPNELGTFDMSGNVLEWVWDNPGLYNESATGINPRGPASVSSFDAGDRVLRGGGFNSIAEACEVLYRNDQSARLRMNQFGFRLAQTVPEQ